MFRKLFCLMLCSALLCQSALAATYAATLFSDHWSNFLFNDEGELLLLFDEPYTVSRIGQKQDWFCLAVETDPSSEPQYALLNAEGVQVTDRLFDGFYDATKNTVIFTEYTDGEPFYGLLDSSGNEILPAAYSVLEPFGNTHLFTLDKGGRVVIIEEDGTSTTTPWIKTKNLSGWGDDYSDLGTYEELLPAIERESGLAGYIDPNGEWVIEPQFAQAEAFRFSGHGLASVYTINMREGMIDMQGNIVIPMEYSMILTGHPRYIEAARVTGNKDSDFYTYSGELVLSGRSGITPCGPGFYDGENKVFLDGSGNEASIDLDTYELRFSEDPCLRHNETKDWHLLTNDLTLTDTGYAVISSCPDTEGGEVYIGCMIFDSHDQDACYGYDEYCTLLDADGNELIPFDKKIICMDDIPYSQYLAFQTENTIGVVDTHGNILLEEPLPQIADDSEAE